MLVMLAIIIDEPFLLTAAEVEKGQSGLAGITAMPPNASVPVCHPTNPSSLHSTHTKLLLLLLLKAVVLPPLLAFMLLETEVLLLTEAQVMLLLGANYLLRHNFEVFWWTPIPKFLVQCTMCIVDTTSAGRSNGPDNIQYSW